MKKWLLALLTIILVSLVCIYAFIPSHLNISKIAPFGCPMPVAYRSLSEIQDWKKWWPGTIIETPGKPDGFKYGSYDYNLVAKSETSVAISIFHKNHSYSSTLILIPLNFDSVTSDWHCELSGGWNPVNRFRKYNEAVQIKKNMDSILYHLQNFLNEKKRVYGIEIEKRPITDTLLITNRNFLDHYPSVTEIYQFIQPIHDYLRQQKAPETSVPMLNVTKTSDGQFKTTVAIATDRKLAGTKSLEPKFMIKGTFLVTEVKGGLHQVQQSLDILNQYATDYNNPVMAMSFQYLVTDRTAVTDSSKWITRVYLPVYQ